MPTAPSIPLISVGAPIPGEAGGGAKAPAGGGGSGGYVFSPEEIDAVIKQWQDLYDELQEDERHAQSVADVKPPGLEFASSDFTDVAGPSGKMLLDQVQRMRQYVRDYIQALTDARDATQATDENASTQASNAGGQA